MERPEHNARRAASGCADCDWYRTQINRAAGDPKPRADLEALFGAHLRRKHGGGDGGRRGLQAV